jgi:superoxide dismutase
MRSTRSRRTSAARHGKHHKTYVDALNKLLPGSEFERMNLEDIVTKATGALYNNAAQTWNHTFFWNCMKPHGGGAPGGALAAAIKAKFGNQGGFKESFTTKAVDNFGSGWTWLVKKRDGSVDIVNMGAAGTPLTTGDKPLLTIDVWEHAYYIDYRNLRPKWVEAFLGSLANWAFAEANFA